MIAFELGMKVGGALGVWAGGEVRTDPGATSFSFASGWEGWESPAGVRPVTSPR